MSNAEVLKRWRVRVSVTLLTAAVGGLAGCLSVPQTDESASTPISVGSATSPEIGDGSSVATVSVSDLTATIGSGQGTDVPPTETVDPNRQAYDKYATQVAAAGGMTLVPYETAVSVETAYQLELTSYAESLFTPTPFGPLPFPGTRLTDEELAQRGWPRIGPGGIRNEDYHTTAIWLDKNYVDAEIFSKYQALFDLLAFRDGPPGEDFEAKLGELMLADDVSKELDEESVSQLRFGETLKSCSREAIVNNVGALTKMGLYLQMDSSKWYATGDLFWRAYQYDFPQHREIGAFTTARLNAFQVGKYFLTEVEVDYPGSVSEQFPVVKFMLRAVGSENVVKEWQNDYSPERDGAHAIFIWTPEREDWYVFRLGSVYCEDYFKTAVQR